MNLFNLLSGIVGLLLGALISLIGYFFKIRRERKRNLKKCLFLLLEIWFDLRISLAVDMDKLISAYLDALRKRFPNEEISISNEELEKILILAQLQLGDIISSSIGKRKQKIFDTYQEVIEKLSEEEPLLAYRLSNRPELRDIISNIDSGVNKYTEKMSDIARDPQAQIFLRSLMSSASKGHILESISEIEKDIYEIAGKVWQRNNAKKLIGEAYLRDIEASNEAVAKILKEIEGAIKMAQADNSPMA